MTNLKELILKNKTLFLILGLITLSVLLLVFQLFQPRTPQPTPQPTPKPTNLYNVENLDKDAQRIENAQTLSTQDQQSKTKLIASLGNKSGVLHQTSTYTIQYIKAADRVLISIENNDTDQVKKDSMAWLESQGLSLQGVCNLPIEFYLDTQVAEYFQQQNKQFDPLPPGC